MAIRVDQDSGSVSRDLDLWTFQEDVVFDFSWPGKPIGKALVETPSANSGPIGLNSYWFTGHRNARLAMEQWRKCSNEVGP